MSDILTKYLKREDIDKIFPHHGYAGALTVRAALLQFKTIRLTPEKALITGFALRKSSGQGATLTTLR